MDAWVVSLEAMEPDARLVSIAYVAGREVDIPAEESNEALRRALVVRAVGGAPNRELALDEDAVDRLAAELDRPERREALRNALESLRSLLSAQPFGESALDALLADDDLAWRCFAAARLAAEVADG